MRHIKFMLILTCAMASFVSHSESCHHFVNERITDGINCKDKETSEDEIKHDNGLNKAKYSLDNQIMRDGINSLYLLDRINSSESELLIDGVNSKKPCNAIHYKVAHYVCTNCGWKSADGATECPECGSKNIQIELT